MKVNIVFLSVLFFFSMGLSAQKDQIKEAQSLYDKGKSEDALVILKKIEYLIVNAPLEEKSDFYFLKGNIYKDLAVKNINTVESFTLASAAYNDVLLYENDAREYKYAFKANVALKEMKSTLVDGAIADYKQGKFKESAEKSYKVYLLDKKDTLNLFNSALASFAGKDFSSATKYYEELRRIKYSGKAVIYYATNKKTKTEEAFVSFGARESSIKAGLYEKPRNEFPKPKDAEIIGSLAYCCLETKNYGKAEMYYDEVLKMNPKCMDCYINLVYTKMQLKRLLLDKMAVLGTSPNEMVEYEKLNVQKEQIEKSAIPYLKQALGIEPKNVDVSNYLLGVYRSLDMTNEYNSLKSSM